MIIFENGELEIAMVTYNRCGFVSEWLEHCYDNMQKRNIHFSIWDSSTNNDTEEYISRFMDLKKDSDIEYHHVDSDIAMGYKAMLPLLNSDSKYIWIQADARYYDFDMMDSKVFPYLKNDIDCVLLSYCDGAVNDGKVYSDKDFFFRDGFISTILYGALILKGEMFEPIKCDTDMKRECDKKYKENWACAFLGYIWEMYAYKKYKALLINIPITYINDGKKTSVWAAKFYDVVIGELCNIMNHLSAMYSYTDIALKIVWEWQWLDKAERTYMSRKDGSWNEDAYRKYKTCGMLDRCTTHGDRMARFAICTDEELDRVLEEEMQTEKYEFEEMCHRNIDKIKTQSNGRKIWIYGAADVGKYLAERLAEQNINVCGFLDQNADNICGCAGKPVKRVQDIDLSDCYIVISLRVVNNDCLNVLFKNGVEMSNIFYMVLEDKMQLIKL